MTIDAAPNGALCAQAASDTYTRPSATTRAPARPAAGSNDWYPRPRPHRCTPTH